MQKAKIDEQVDEGVLVGDGFAVAKNGALDAEGFGLGVDALDGGALVVDKFVGIGVTVEGVTETSA